MHFAVRWYTAELTGGTGEFGGHGTSLTWVYMARFNGRGM